MLMVVIVERVQYVIVSRCVLCLFASEICLLFTFLLMTDSQLSESSRSENTSFLSRYIFCKFIGEDSLLKWIPC